jgi:methylenetetrahydrofolate dehydrogenase (NADP+)/methenyltetrahydrofolate cyclohydrolase
MTLVLEGKSISLQIKEELKEKTANLVNLGYNPPGLAVLLVGENPASQAYVKSKEKSCLDLGYYSIVHRVDATISENEVLEIIEDWNNRDDIHGILVQLPLPKHIDENKVILKILPSKDVDGFHPENFGRLVIGLDAHYPCTPAGIIELLKRYNIETKGKHAVVLGRSNIVGKPILNLMYQKHLANSVVTIVHTGTKDFKYYTKQADILIAAIGVPKMIKSDDIKEGCVIIDVGINRIDADNEKGYKIVGDVDYEDVFEKCAAITPVPGGVGLMTIAMLMQNTYNSALKLQNVKL